MHGTNNNYFTKYIGVQNNYFISEPKMQLGIYHQRQRIRI